MRCCCPSSINNSGFIHRAQRMAPPRTVRFDDNVKVRPLVTWAFASRAARIGPWMWYAQDRAWFKQKIQCIEPILEPVLRHKLSVIQKATRD